MGSGDRGRSNLLHFPPLTLNRDIYLPPGPELNHQLTFNGSENSIFSWQTAIHPHGPLPHSIESIEGQVYNYAADIGIYEGKEQT